MVEYMDRVYYCRRDRDALVSYCIYVYFGVMCVYMWNGELFV